VPRLQRSRENDGRKEVAVPTIFERTGVQKALVSRVLGEYRDMPGLSPTLAQAQRLFGLDDRTCRTVLDLLVRARFLSRDSKGRYVRFDLAS
jgi:hypothetical protein